MCERRRRYPSLWEFSRGYAFMSSIDRDYVGKHLGGVEEAISVILEDCSVWSETHHVSEESSGEEVKAVTLDELLDLAEGETLVKMDIEGAELLVLKESRKLSKVFAISVEAHSNTEEIEGALCANGFAVKILRYPIAHDLAYRWAKVKPKAYSLLIAAYRLIASSLAKPVVTIVKGVRN